MEDADGNFVVDEIWKETEGSWQYQEVEYGHEIVGF